MLSTAVSAGGNQQGKIESRIVQVDSNEFKYQIYLPPQIQNEQNLPLIIFLHGIAQRGSSGLVPTGGAAGAVARHYFAQDSGYRFIAAVPFGKLLVRSGNGRDGIERARADD
ncbi:MAG: hypothetical protein WKF71_11950 [Pyrinomonadaceae bacterium]